MTHDEMIEVIRGFDQGKPVEARRRRGGFWIGASAPCWDFSTYDFRLKPTPTRVPLGPEDFPPGTVVRGASTEEWEAVTMAGSRVIFFGPEGASVSYKDMVNGPILRLLPGQTEWLPCWREG